MDTNLVLITQDIDFIRNQPKWVQFQPKNTLGNVIDCSLVTAAKLIVSHAQTTNPADRVTVIDAGFGFFPDRVEHYFDFAAINALPLGAFLYELLISDDGVWYYTSYQGSINVYPSLLQQ